MAEESVCERCGGPVHPTGGRSRGGLGVGPDDDVAWQPWRETGVCLACGAVHRRPEDVAGALWRATGLIAAHLAQTLGGRRVALTGDLHSRAVMSGELTVSTLGAEHTPVDGPVLNLRWGSTAEVTALTATDYGALQFLGVVFTVVFMATDDAGTSGGAAFLAWLLLVCPYTRGAILRLTRDMHGD